MVTGQKPFYAVGDVGVEEWEVGRVVSLVDRVELVGIDSLVVSTRNPRRGDVAAIKQSLSRNAQYAPVIVNRRTGEVLVGNHRVMAARELGWGEVAVCFVDVDDEHARRIMLADNRSSDLAGYDDQALVDLLLEAGDELLGTGFDRSDLDALLDAVSDQDPIADDDVPAPPAEARTSVGELVELGEHRLVCGDARDPATLAAVMEGDQASCLLTDPPYGALYEGKTPKRLRIRNDHPDQVEALLRAVFGGVDACLLEGASVYVFHPTGAVFPVFVDAFLGVGWQLRQSLVWVKDAMVLGHADYHFQHESILYGAKPASTPGRWGRGGAGWYGDNRQVSVFDLPRPRAARDHPTMKPTELIARMLRNSTRRRDLVLDPFAGSGSTMVACESLGRRARMVEIDPRYCDVIIDRYHRLATTTNQVV
jgi:DNA modification methylase